jgi:hypothetical protein
MGARGLMGMRYPLLLSIPTLSHLVRDKSHESRGQRRRSAFSNDCVYEVRHPVNYAKQKRRTSKYVLQDYHSSYADRLKLLNLLPISYWYEMKDIICFYKIKSGLYDLNPEDYIDHPTHHPTRFSSTNCYRPNLCRTWLPISEVPSSTELCLCGTTFLKIWNPPPLLPHSNINWRTTTGTNLKHSLTLIVQGHGKPFVLNVVLVLLLVVHDSWERSKLSLHFQNVFCFSLFE